MKQKLTLILAFSMIVALFAGCGGLSSTATPTATPTLPDSSTADSPEKTPEEEPPHYNFALGQFDSNEAGYATAPFTYELPLSTSNEVFTYWTTSWTPRLLPEGGWDELETMAYIEELTGVHIEYEVIASDARSSNFSVLLASDDLRDIMDQATFFWPGELSAMIDEGRFINFYDYRGYMPNYTYELYARNDIDVLKYGRIDDTTWPAMYGIVTEATPDMGYMLRQDWMDDWGLGEAADVVTLDDWHNVLLAFQANGVQWPLSVYATIDLCSAWSMFDTAVLVSDRAMPAARVVDGQVQYTLTTADDFEALSLLNSWYAEKLIDPNYASYADNNQFAGQITGDATGCVAFAPSEVANWESLGLDPDTTWRPTPYVKKTEDQVFRFGHKANYFHTGSACVSAKCENIPLVCSWLDWKWSPEGNEVDNWGKEGLTYTVLDNGQKQLTDFILSDPTGSVWIMVLYTNDSLRQPCLSDPLKMYAYPGGELFLEMFEVWRLDGYTGEYDLPTGIVYTAEQTEALNRHAAALSTYIAESCFAFFDGSRPLSEWDSYVETLAALGLDACTAIVQEAYDAYVN